MIENLQEAWLKKREDVAWNKPYEGSSYVPKEDQMGLLHKCLVPDVEVLFEDQENDYQGDCFAVLRRGPLIVLWRDSFGSCSGCDALQAGDEPYEYFKATLAEGNTRQFSSFAEAAAYLRQPDLDYGWKCHAAGFADRVEALK